MQKVKGRKAGKKGERMTEEMMNTKSLLHPLVAFHSIHNKSNVKESLVTKLYFV